MEQFQLFPDFQEKEVRVSNFVSTVTNFAHLNSNFELVIIHSLSHARNQLAQVLSHSHTHTYTHIHTHTHSQIHAPIHTHIQTHTYTHKLIRPHPSTFIETLTLSSFPLSLSISTIFANIISPISLSLSLSLPLSPSLSFSFSLSLLLLAFSYTHFFLTLFLMEGSKH